MGEKLKERDTKIWGREGEINFCGRLITCVLKQRNDTSTCYGNGFRLAY